jgi:hypothetical protein
VALCPRLFGQFPGRRVEALQIATLRGQQALETRHALIVRRDRCQV